MDFWSNMSQGAGTQGVDHPLLAYPAWHRDHRRLGTLDAEAGRQQATYLGAADVEGRAATATATYRKKARQEPAARLDDRRHHPHVFGTPARVDGAEARVFPDAVERVRVVTFEGEDVTLLEDRAHALIAREPPRLGDGSVREVEARRIVAVAGEQASVVPATAARHGHAATRRRRGGEPALERRVGPTQLPAVAARVVEVLPEAGRVYSGHASPSKSAIARSTPAARSSASLCAVARPITRMPAARAARTPTSESSKTRQASAPTPRPRAAR